MVIRVDPSRGEPLFRQIVDSVKRDVGTGRLVAGDRLPSVRELAKELVINPNTIVRAYQALEAEGVIVSRRGSGTYVAKPRRTLADTERRRRLGERLDALLADAAHLGFTEAEVRAAFEATVDRYREGLADPAEAGEEEEE